jgi:hypothetical protein
MSKPRVARCGTTSGYDKHQRHGERPCNACALAKAVYDKKWQLAPRRKQLTRLHARAQSRALQELSRRYPTEYKQLYEQYKAELLAAVEVKD